MPMSNILACKMESVQHLLTTLSAQAASLSSFECFLRKYSSTEIVSERLALLKAAFDLAKFDSIKGELRNDEYSNEILLAEMFQDALEFGLNKGFSCDELNHFLTLYLRTLTIVAGVPHSEQVIDVTLPRVLDTFKSVLFEYSDKMAHRHILGSASYITDTIFKNFRLYHYLLTQEQPLDLTTFKLHLSHPLSPKPLSEAKKEQEWVQSEKIAALESRQENEQKEFREAHDVIIKKDEEKLKDVYQNELSKMAGHVQSEEEIRHVVEALTTAHLQSAKVTLSQTLQQQIMLLEMKTEKLELLSPRQKPISKEE